MIAGVIKDQVNSTAAPEHHGLREVSFPEAYGPGARNAVTTCLRIQPDEKVTVITDQSCVEIAASIAHELDKIGCAWNGYVLEEVAPRPLNGMPRVILDDMETSQVSIFAVNVQQNELKSRMEMTDVVNRRRMRHAHMVNITGEIMVQGMRADFMAIDALSQAVLDKVRKATYVRATTAAGTDIHAQLSPDYRWFKTSGIISPEKWGNLPGGECFTAPGEVNGVFVVDGVVGDYLCARYGLLRETPLTINIESNRITKVECSNKELEREFWAYTHTDANSDRVGEFAIGTNIGVERVIGNILQDEKFPGIHIAFGDPYGAHTGAPWKSSTHIDVVGLGFNIWLGNADGEEQIMRDGDFLLEV
ncbi:Leucyl aminopeptidase (aminopeptidase T) [Granulicella pectinivorans]|jgi:leucyl aminopeptidase (aminopeptidase T)|uniref:Leucyl aminopeptidase (Aminopeptidase T) n=1 Tax=Granulicella pectinivorans TaxID=474950 RepID=A0A1I6MY62_9BACT|nr:aminopeptidase [Granulicella pectinivorans]SFS20650.1 Leucyl aminopeptidase (aminopeptidase T) [Granulicella pectinivorans]